MFVDIFTLLVLILHGAILILSATLIVFSVCSIISTVIEVREFKMRKSQIIRKEDS